MWTTLALLGALSTAPAQPALRLTNGRLTYGLWGAERADNSYYPGDQCFIAFDMENIRIGPDGKVSYRTELEARDGSGRVLFKQRPQDLEVLASLGGTTLPGYSSVDVGMSVPPGEYSVSIKVTDKVGGGSDTLRKRVRVLPKGFALVRPQLMVGEMPAPPVAVTGQDVFAHVAVVGFTRPKGGQPHVKVELSLLDEKKTPTLDKPFTGEIKAGVPDKALHLPVHFLLKLNRSGKFTVQLKATDLLARKTAEVSFPIIVIKPIR
jgi:hypothetical protein